MFTWEDKKENLLGSLNECFLFLVLVRWTHSYQNRLEKTLLLKVEANIFGRKYKVQFLPSPKNWGKTKYKQTDNNNNKKKQIPRVKKNIIHFCCRKTSKQQNTSQNIIWEEIHQKKNNSGNKMLGSNPFKKALRAEYN